MPISFEEYTDAVKFLLKTAMGDTSGSRVSAQVLLSCYNGYMWQLDVTDLSLLDREHYIAALTAIRGRIEVRREPHSMIEGGSRQFEYLCEIWSHLSVKERGKTSCWNCDGRGEVYANRHDENDLTMETCYSCGGKGRYWEE